MAQNHYCKKQSHPTQSALEVINSVYHLGTIIKPDLIARYKRSRQK